MRTRLTVDAEPRLPRSRGRAIAQPFAHPADPSMRVLELAVSAVAFAAAAALFFAR